MLMITENIEINLVDELDKEKYLEVLSRGYAIKPAYIELVYELLGKFDKAIVVQTPIFIGSSKHIISLACTSYTEFIHEFMPYMDEYIFVTDISFSIVPMFGFCINFYYVEHTFFKPVITNFLRKSIIDTILSDIC